MKETGFVLPVSWCLTLKKSGDKQRYPKWFILYKMVGQGGFDLSERFSTMTSGP